MREVLLNLVRVPWDALRLLWRHWPTLISVCALGLAVRQGVLWVAVMASDWWSTLGVLILPVAALAMMVALIVMLRVLRVSLPALQPGPDEPPAHRGIVAVLLPFLAVYASQGLLREDAIGFIRDASQHESMTAYLTADYSRVMIAQGWYLVAVVLVAMVARKLIVGYELSRKSPGWGVFATYLEALWMVTLGAAFTTQINDLTTWVTTRQAWSWWIDLRDYFYSLAGVIGDVVKGTLGAIGTVLNSAGSLVVVPVAWLSVGALVYGAQLAEAKKESKDEAAPSSRRDVVVRTVRKRVRAVAEDVVSPVTGPVKSAWAAMRKIAVAGIGPMVLFCLVFALAQQSSVAIAELTRIIVGPQEPKLTLALRPYYELAQRLTYFVVMVVLLAAAINRVVESASAQRQPDVVGGVPAEL